MLTPLLGGWDAGLTPLECTGLLETLLDSLVVAPAGGLFAYGDGQLERDRGLAAWILTRFFLSIPGSIQELGEYSS